MANRPNVFAEGRQILPTEDLYVTKNRFNNNVPAYTNIYDVWINFDRADGLTNFVNQHGFYDKGGRGSSIGSALSLFCSEAVLPGSTIETSEIRGLRQGVAQNYATFRSYPDISLTWYSQKDYYTNDVFNAWMEYISPTRIEDGRFGQSSRERMANSNSYRRMKYPNHYKCDMQITGFSKDMYEASSRIGDIRGGGRLENPRPEFPSSITYFLQNLFPINIVASPLAYGKAELVKTTVTFKYEYYYIDRTSRVQGDLKSPTTFKVSDSGNNRRRDNNENYGTDNAGRDFDDRRFNLSGID